MRRALLVLAFAAACGRTVVYDPPEVPPTKPVVDAGVITKPCMTGTVTLAHATPSIYFVVDRSGSMAFDLFGNPGTAGMPLMGPSRWQILTDVMGQVLPQHQAQLAMGIIFFPSDAQCGSTTVAAVTPRLGNAAALRQQFTNRRPAGGTPIAAAMLGVRGPAVQAGAKSLVLITDGEPNCNAMLDPNVCTCTQATMGNPPMCQAPDACLDDTRTVSTLAGLHTDGGVVTHVVGFATTDRAAVTLDAMAVAGGAPNSGQHKFHSAETQAELASVLQGISERESNCTWTALTALKAEDVLEVRLDGELIPFGAGWAWLDPMRGEFALRGEWCERSIGHDVTAQLTCQP